MGIKKDMFPGIYQSGAQCEIWLGTKRLDEVAELEFTYNYDHLPIYSYGAYHANSIVGTRVIAMGSLTINYRFDGYLYAFIKNAMNFAIPSREIEPAVTDNDAQLFASELTDKNIVALKKQFWGNTDSTKLFPYTSPRADFTGPFNIEIKDYQITDNKPQIKRLVDCFVNRSASVRRVDGTPIVEVYQFIARSVIPYIPSEETNPTGEPSSDTPYVFDNGLPS